ncbi:MAG: hypothetical protein KAW41_00465 [Candidatus Diapherotrites archaeon]|nr:hypothetical protein [Candidatus Diapherotrites archaeon]
MYFKIPTNKKEYGVVTVFNLPDLEAVANLSEVPYYHPVVSGALPVKDYGGYDWVLTGLKGVEDAFGNNASKYAVNSKAFLPGEGVLVFSNISSSSVFLYDEDGELLQSNSLLNPGFEGALGHWTKGDGDWVVSSDGAIGSHSLLLASTGKTTKASVYQDFDVLPNTTYNVSGWMKTNILETSGDGANIYFRTVNGSGEKVGNCAVGNIKGTNAWAFYSKAVDSGDAYDARLTLRSHKASGDAFFDGLLVRESTTNMQSGSVLWLSGDSGTTYSIKAANSSANGSVQITVEKIPVFTCFGGEADTKDIIVGRGIFAESRFKVSSKAVGRPQAVVLAPETGFPGDVVAGSCASSTGTECWGTVVLAPGGKVSGKFSWEENGVSYNIAGVSQNFSAQSTPSMQKLVKRIVLTNDNSARNLTGIRGYVRVDGTCVNSDETHKIDWVKGWSLGPGTCYYEVGELAAGESIELEIGFYGDFIDMSLGAIEQDPDRQSTLDTQFFRRLVGLDFLEIPVFHLDAIDWELSTELCEGMPGNCFGGDLRIVSDAPPELLVGLSFDESQPKDFSSYHSSCALKPNASDGPKQVNGKFGKALEFSGNSYVEIENKHALNTSKPFSLAFWVKYDGVIDDKEDTYENIFGAGEVYKHGFRVGLRQKSCSHGLRFRVNSGTEGSAFCASPAIDDGEWHHVALVSNGTAVIAYHNGEVYDTLPNPDFNVDEITADFWVGGSEGFNGAIDEVRLYSKELPPTEVQSLFLGVNESKALAVYSNTSELEYTVGVPRKKEWVDGSQRWAIEVSVNNSFDIDLHGVSGAVPVDGEVVAGSLEGPGLANITYNGSAIAFVVPSLEKKSLATFSVEYSTAVEPEAQTEIEIDLPATDTSPTSLTGLLGFLGLGDSGFTDSMLLSFEFEEGAGNITHNAGGGDNGEIHGAPRWTVGHDGLALQFDGVDDYVRVPVEGVTWTDHFTISIWVYPTATSGEDEYLFANANLNKSDGFHLSRRGGQAVFWVGGSEPVRLSGGSLPENKWHYVAAVVRDGEALLHVDGEMVDSSPVSGLHNSGRDYIIGQNTWSPGSGSRAFTGKLDDLRVYGNGFSEQEVKAMRAGMGAQWSFFYVAQLEHFLLALVVLAAIFISYIEFKVKGQPKRWWED